MKKRDVIVISVLVNAGLLLILFISAITTKDPQMSSSQTQMSMQNFDPATFSESPTLQEVVSELEAQKDLKDMLPLPDPQVIVNETAIEQKQEEKEVLIHKLPGIVKQPVLPTKQTFITVVVKSGDSLEKIAKRNNTTIAEIEKNNGLTSHLLQIGQVLRIPEKGTKEKQTEKKIENNNSASSEYYVVKCGDNPWTIAMKHHIKVQDLLKLNNLNNEKAKKIKPGDKLRIR